MNALCLSAQSLRVHHFTVDQYGNSGKVTVRKWSFKVARSSFEQKEKRMSDMYKTTVTGIIFSEFEFYSY